MFDDFRHAIRRLAAGRHRERDPGVLLLAGEDPVGRGIRFSPSGPLMEIVGVLEAGKYQTVTEEPPLAVWRPLAQSYNSTSTLVARTSLSGREALSSLTRSVEAIAPRAPPLRRDEPRELSRSAD